MQPYQWPETFGSQYDCLMFGYKESIVKMEELGKTDVIYGVQICVHCTVHRPVLVATLAGHS